jgi:hypothetical protein
VQPDPPRERTAESQSCGSPVEQGGDRGHRSGVGYAFGTRSAALARGQERAGHVGTAS